MATYQGWENWETWRAFSILDGDGDFKSWIIDAIRDDEFDDIDVRSNDLIFGTADFIASYFLGDIPETPTPWSEYLNSALERINWFELAQWYLKKWHFLTKGGERRLPSVKDWSPSE